MIWGCFSKAGIGQICLCEGLMTQATYKVVLEEHLLPPAQCSPTLRIGFSSNTIVLATQPGQSDPVMANPIENL